MEIFDNVFLGNRYDAANASLLKGLRIGCVLNVTDDLKNHFENKITVEQKVYVRQDEEDSTDAVSQIILAEDGGCVVEGLGLGMASHNDAAVDLVFDQEDEPMLDTPTPTEMTPTFEAKPDQVAAVSFDVEDSSTTADRKIVKAKRKNDKKKNVPPVYNVEIVEFEKAIKYKRISLPDSMEQDLKQHFAEGVEFIHQGTQCDETGRQFCVLVHCREARSRSVSMLVAYAMNKLGWTLAQAFNHIQTKTHHHTRINDGFKRQLMEYELELMLSRRVGDNMDLNESTLTNTFDFFPRRKRNRSYAEAELEYDSSDYDEEDEYEEIQPQRKRARKTKNGPRASEIANSFPTVDSAGRKQMTLFSMFKKKILQQAASSAPQNNIIVPEPVLVQAQEQVESDMKQIPDDATREQVLLHTVEEQVKKLDALIKAKQASAMKKVVAAATAPKTPTTPKQAPKKLADVTNKKKQTQVSISSFFKKV